MRSCKDILLIVILACALSARSQTAMPGETIGACVGNPEEMASYPGGMQMLAKYINERVTSKIVLTQDEGAVVKSAYARFVIDESGRIDSVRIIRTSNVPYVDSMLVSALSHMPAWTPSKMNGKPKRQVFNFPLTICLK